MIDWNAPLEAVHTDGRTAALRLLRVDAAGDGWTTNGGVHIYDELCWSPEGETEYNNWRIRNVQPAWRTSAEQLDRMNALVERIANGMVDKSQTPLSIAINTEIVSEARAILAARGPVDTRFNKVLGVPQQNERWLMPEDAARRFVRDVLAALDA